MDDVPTKRSVLIGEAAQFEDFFRRPVDLLAVVVYDQDDVIELVVGAKRAASQI